MSERAVEERRAPPDSPIRDAAACGGVFLILYLSTLSGNHVEAEDALQYVNDITSGESARMSSPYHIAYGWLGRATLAVASRLGYAGDPIVPLQIVNAVAGALGLALLWVLLRTVGPGSRLPALAACGLTGLSYGYWWYSVEVEVYLPSVALLILGLLLAHRAATEPTMRAFALLGLVHALAVLAHITNVLSGLIAVVSMLAAWRARPGGPIVRWALCYAAPAVGVVLAAYAWVTAEIGLASRREVADWLAAYPSSGTWGDVTATSPIKALIGASRALVGGHPLFSFEVVQHGLARALPGKGLEEEVFLVQGMRTPQAVVLLLTGLVAVAALLLLIARWLRRPSPDPDARVLAVQCLAWAVPYGLFFTWWEPVNSEFWIATWIPLTVLIALPLSRSVGNRPSIGDRAVVGVLLSALLVSNLFGSVLPQHDPDGDYWRVRSSWYEEHARPSDLIVAGHYIGANYLDHYTPARVLLAPDDLGDVRDVESLAAFLGAAMARTGTTRVLVSSSALESPAGAQDACHVGQRCSVQLLLRDALSNRGRVLHDGPLDETVFVVVPPADT